MVLVFKNNRDAITKRFCSCACSGVVLGRERSIKMNFGLISKPPRQTPEVILRATNTRKRRMAIGGIPNPPRKVRTRLLKKCSKCDKIISTESKNNLCRTCFNHAKTKRLVVECDNCRHRISRIPSLIGDRNFCDRDCMSDFRLGKRSKLITYFCEECDKECRGYKSQLNGKRSFCSGRCQGIFNGRENRTTCSFYIDGRTPLRFRIKRSWRYSDWVKQVLGRDEFCCTRCGSSDGLHSHHIKPFSDLLGDFLDTNSHLSINTDEDILFDLAMEFNPFWDIDNGLTLCVHCHALEHPNVNLFGSA